MNIKSLMHSMSYKKVFNKIHKYYLKEKTNKEVTNIDRNLYLAWGNLLKTKHKQSKYKEIENCEIHLIEIDKDKGECAGDNYIDVCLYDKEEDDLFALDFQPWEYLIEKDIITSINLNNEELVAHILWEITFWGYSSEKVKKTGDDILKEASEEVESLSLSELKKQL